MPDPLAIEPKRLGRSGSFLADGRTPGHAITDVIVAHRTGQVDVGHGALDRAITRVRATPDGTARRDALVHLAAVSVATADRG